MLDGESLGADNPKFLLFLLRGKGGNLFGIHGSDECILAQPLLQAGLIFAQLALYRGNRRVDGSKHVGGTLRHADNRAAGAHGELHVVPVLLHAEDDGGLRVRLKITV